MTEPPFDVAPAFQLLGKRWNGLLSALLGELTEAGQCERAVSSGPPVAVTYRLTASGYALGPAFEALTTWAAH